MLDLINNRHRTADFLGTRANFIQDRVRVLALVFAGIVFGWIVVDYFTIPDRETVIRLTALRALFAALYLGLAFIGAKPHDLPRARLKLAFLVTLPCVFYILSRFVLEDGAPPGVIMVYAFFPFVTVAQLGVFSLPLLEGAALAIVPFVTLFVVEALFGELLSLPFLGDLTLLLLLTCLALWASMSELQMLLRLYRQATRDPLTGLFNRGALIERTRVELERTERNGHKLCVLLLDLDKFKRINDDHGHLTGDAVLNTFAQILQRVLRKSDLIGRYGGEEFLAVLPRTSAADAELLAEQIRTACTDAEVTSPDGDNVRFTTSVGVARLKPGETVQGLLRRVDKSLYRAKEAGRDCVILAA
jgi:diguanylate cyclase (GGDEF)-like protein